MSKIKVLIVDDSAVIRTVLSRMLSEDNEIEVVGTAPDPYIAIEKIKLFKPDVITLDIEMPKMDGITFLERLMGSHPMPVIMISTWTSKNSEKAIKSLSLGAFDVVEKPNNNNMIIELKAEIIEKIKNAARCQINFLNPRTASTHNIEIKAKSYDNFVPEKPIRINKENQIILMGASTGGTIALENILKVLPAKMPGIVIVQHMPANFTKAFAERLDTLCNLSIKEAQNGDNVLDGHVYIAPGGKQCYVQRNMGKYKILVTDDDPVNRHRPSVDALFLSASKYNCDNVIGVILTGMGKDGAQGMLSMRKTGSYNISQSEQTCVVYGMPREAYEIGASNEVQNLGKIAERLITLTK